MSATLLCVISLNKDSTSFYSSMYFNNSLSLTQTFISLVHNFTFLMIIRSGLKPPFKYPIWYLLAPCSPYDILSNNAIFSVFASLVLTSFFIFLKIIHVNVIVFIFDFKDRLFSHFKNRNRNKNCCLSRPTIISLIFF